MTIVYVSHVMTTFRSLLIVSLTSLCAGSVLHAGSSVSDSAVNHAHASTTAAEVNWLTGEGVSLGGILFPHAHFSSVYGQTTADEQEHFGAGHHDPVSDGWTIQGFEFGASVRATDWLEGFATYHVFQDAASRDWDGEFEEGFLKLKNLPGGFEVRGGRYMNRFGFQNQVHSHGWDFVDNNLVNGRFLGDHGMSTIGGEVTWTLPVSWTSVLSVSLGEAQSEEHEEAHEEESGHGHEDFAFEGEDSQYGSTLTVVNWTNQLDYNDFNQFRFGLSGAFGDNKMSKSSQVYGTHFEYLWRQNGYESGGSYLRFRTEMMLRNFDYSSAHEEEEHHDEESHAHAEEHEHSHEAERHSGSETEFGMYTSLIYGMENGLELGIRGDYVEGIASTELSERYRISPSATYYFNKNRTLYVRSQYNYDHGDDFGDEHSVWAQVGFNWGGPEVR